MATGVQPGRWGALRFGAVGKEVVHGLVCVGKRVALRQARDDAKDFVDARRQSRGQFLRRLQASGREIFDNLMQLAPETVGGAEEKTVVRALGGFKPTGVVTLGA